MLGKLFKYEIKATARIFLPMYLLLTMFAIINLLFPFREGSMSISQVITIALYVIILVGMFVVSFFVIIDRFRKNLLSEEGYLMFTIPVKPYKHIICKALVSLMWVFTSFIVAFISIVIIALQDTTLLEIFTEFSDLWNQLYLLLGVKAYEFFIQIVVGAIVSSLSSFLMIYVSIAIGHLSNNHKKMLSIGAFLGIYAFISFISGKIFFRTVFDLPPMQYAPTSHTMVYPFSFIWLAIGLSVLYGAIFYIVTNVLLTKRLNLE